MGVALIGNVKIYGHRGVALFEDDGEMRILHLHQPDHPRAIHSADLNYFSLDDPDFVTLDDGASVGGIVGALQADRRKHNALLLTIEGLDRSYSDVGRNLAISGADKRMDDPDIQRFVQNRMYAFAVPQGADIEGGVKRADGKWEKAQALYEGIRKHRSYINHFVNVWTLKVAPKVSEHSWAYRLLLADQGGFYTLASDPWENPETRGNYLGFQLKNHLDTNILDLVFQLLEHPPRANYEEAGLVESSLWGDVIEEQYQSSPPRKKTKKKKNDNTQADMPGARHESLAELLSIWPDHPENANSDIEKINSQLNYISSEIHKGKSPAQIEPLIADLISYQKKHSRRTHMAKSLCAIATAWEKHGAYDAEVDLLVHAKELSPNDPFPLIQLANLCQVRNRMDEARFLYEEAVSRFPDDAVARNGLAETYRQQGDLVRATSFYEETVSRFPDNIYARNGLAEAYRQQGNLGRAASLYEEIISGSPDDVVARCGLAETYRQQGDLVRAISLYEEVVSRFPDNAVPRNGLAETYRQKGDLGRAISLYEEAISRFPDDAVPRNGLAETYRQKGDLGRAVSFYEETVSRFPDDVYARNGLAEAYRQQGDLGRAASLYKEIVSGSPNDVVARCGLAETYRQQGDLGRAISLYEETISRFPDDVVPRNGLSSILIAQKRFDKARELLALESYQTESEWISFHILAFSYVREGKLSRGLRLLAHGLNSVPFPRHKKYFASALAVAKLRAGSYQEALNILKLDDYRPGGREAVEERVLEAHARAALGQTKQASQIIKAASRFMSPIHCQVSDDLSTRFLLNEKDGIPSDEIHRLDKKSSMRKRKWFFICPLPHD